MMTDPYMGTTLVFCDILGEPEIAFAWLPTRCFDGQWVWLRPVWRRLCVLRFNVDGCFDPWWQYARA
jgi:hypothetical protein